MILLVFFICLLLGAIVGFLAGLLGIGGGLIIVPALVYLLPWLNINHDLIMPMALATSLASIIVTSSSAVLAHHKHQNIAWPIAKKLAVFIAFGAGVGAYLVHLLSTQSLKTFFAVAVAMLAAYMLFSLQKKQQGKIVVSDFLLQIISFFTGIIASLMGIAGGAILVPALNYCSFELRKAMAIATVCGVAVAVFSSLVFIITGWAQGNLPAYSLGYIYLPALFGIVLSSSLFAKIGVKMATRLPTRTLKKYFALFLMLVAIKMLWS